MPLYSSIDDLARQGGLTLVQQELNASQLYTSAVRALHWKEIGLRIRCPDALREYASRHDPDGRIEQIVPYFTHPNIIVIAPESVLLEIAQNVEWVKEHTFQAVIQYGPQFQMRREDYRRILGSIIRVGQESLSPL